jgi:hypothetical protein
MDRFDLIRTGQSAEKQRISNGFIRLLAAESARLGGDAPRALTFQEQELSVRERYAPMQRLLAQDDELFLIEQGARASAKRLRREHRSCYFDYLNRLKREIRAARRLRTVAMASREQWSFWVLLAYAVLSESSLLYLRWLGCRHALGITVAARDVRECLDFLLVAPQFAPATT